MSTRAPAANAYAFPLTIRQLWNAPLVHSPDQVIVYRDQVRYTYRGLRERVGRLASLLQELGVQFGDTVAMMDWDSHRYLESFYGVPMMGAVLQTVNVRLSPDQILYTLNHARPKVLLVNSDFAPILNEIRGRLDSVHRIVWISDDGVQAPSDTAGDYEVLMADSDPNFTFEDFDENTVATTFYTTGTTGLPKGVFFTHRQLVLHTLVTMAAISSPASGQRFHTGDVYMPLTPMFHVHAWGMPYVALQMGVKQVYPGRYIPDALVRSIQKERVTFSHCVPTVLQMVLNAAAAGSVDLRGWKVVIGGSALSEALAGKAVSQGIDIFAGYGMSETCPILTLAQIRPRHDGLREAEELSLRCRAGAPVPLVALRTVDDSFKDVTSGGEIVVRAPWLTQGYAGNESASEALWQGGYLHTADIGALTGGYLKITDRIKDVIKTGGEWVSSLEVEDLLSRHDSVSEVAVIGVPDTQWGERPVALIVPRTAGVLNESELRDFLMNFVMQGLISRYAIPSKFQIVDALDKTSVGKLDKKILRTRFAS